MEKYQDLKGAGRHSMLLEIWKQTGYSEPGPLKFLLQETCITFGEGNGNPLQHSCLENPMDGGAWQATVQGVTKSRTELSN